MASKKCGARVCVVSEERPNVCISFKFGLCVCVLVVGSEP